MHTQFPRLKSVKPLAGKRLCVTFVNDAVRIYDCGHLLESEPFKRLRDETFFRCVHVEPHGYAVVWDEQLDLAESELWLHGKSPNTRLQRAARGAAAEA